MKFVSNLLRLLPAYSLQDVMNIGHTTSLSRGNQSSESLFAIGISLASSYGTISIRDSNGSFTDVGRIDNDLYLKMMRRLSLPSSRHLSPPYLTLTDMLDDAPRQLYRAGRKRLWLPASSDVGVVSKMLQELLCLLDSDDSNTKYSISISIANVGALYEEDIRDAAEYLRLELIHTSFKFFEPREIFTAYAGYGMGLCPIEVANDEEKCEMEVRKLPPRLTLLVEYTKEAFLIHIRWLDGARDYLDFWDNPVSETSFDLGSKAREIPGYWNQVTQLVRKYLLLHLRYTPDVREITILITGDSDTQSMTMMETALKVIITDENEAATDVFNSSPEYVAARGVAEIQWRAMILTAVSKSE